MKFVASILLLLCIVSAQAVETVAVGVGKSAAAALANAKEVAVGQVAGTFVVGRQWATGSEYGERTEEYSGGYLRRYDVINTREDGGLFQVSIRADVDSSKSNTRLDSAGAEIPPGWADEMEKSRDELARIRRMVVALDDRSQAFSVEVTRLGYRNRGESTLVEVELEVGWQPKWIDDIDALAKAIDRKVEIGNSTAGFLWAVAALSAVIAPGLPGNLFSLARAAENKGAIRDDYAVCVGTNAWTAIDRCHEIRHELPQVTGSNRIRISGSVTITDRVLPLDTITVDTETYLFRHVQAGREYYFSRGGHRTFPNPGVLLFRNGRVSQSYSFALPTEELRNVRQIEFVAR